MFEAILFLIDNNTIIRKDIPNFNSYTECVQFIKSKTSYDLDNAYLTLDKKKYKLWIHYCK